MFCLFYILCRITRWGEGKSTSIMQSPAAYTLPVKLLTSTNDFLMIGPSIPQSCLLTNTLTHTHTHIYHAFAPTHNHNEFYQGKYMWFNGSLQMPFPLTLLYLSSNKMLLFPRCHLFFWETTCCAWILQMMMYLRCGKLKSPLSKDTSEAAASTNPTFQANNEHLRISANIFSVWPIMFLQLPVWQENMLK